MNTIKRIAKIKTINKWIALNLTFIIMISVIGNIPVSAHDDFTDQAYILKDLGLFKGTENGFELDRYGTRIEAAVIIVRLLGAETLALNLNYDHPYVDVPSWADAYVGYLHHEGLTNGVGDYKYGSTINLTPNQFLTFALRSLTYDDSNGDFVWDQAMDKALELKIIDDNFMEHLNSNTNIYRDDIVAIMYNLLNQQMNEEDTSLIDYLITKNVTTLEKAMELGIYNQVRTTTLTGEVISINTSKKAVITDTVNGYNYYVIVPFGQNEDVYTSVIYVDVDEVTYECVIPKEIYYTQEMYQTLNVGQSITITGEFATNVLESSENHTYIIIK